MSTVDDWRQRQNAWQQQIGERRQLRTLRKQLELATVKVQKAEQARLTAERERLAVLMAAHDAGLSCATIVRWTDVSRSQVHHLLQARRGGEKATAVLTR